MYAYARQTWFPKAVALDHEDVMMEDTIIIIIIIIIIILIIFYRNNKKSCNFPIRVSRADSSMYTSQKKKTRKASFRIQAAAWVGVQRWIGIPCDPKEFIQASVFHLPIMVSAHRQETLEDKMNPRHLFFGILNPSKKYWVFLLRTPAQNLEKWFWVYQQQMLCFSWIGLRGESNYNKTQLKFSCDQKIDFTPNQQDDFSQGNPLKNGGIRIYLAILLVAFLGMVSENVTRTQWRIVTSK